jgi:hypothetical protein
VRAMGVPTRSALECDPVEAMVSPRAQR